MADMADMSGKTAARALQTIRWEIDRLLAPVGMIVMDMAEAALRGPVPDPETGLVPCGCGGHASFCFGRDWKGRLDDSCFVICMECGQQSGTVCGEVIARSFWNRAMGYHEEGANG